MTCAKWTIISMPVFFIWILLTSVWVSIKFKSFSTFKNEENIQKKSDIMMIKLLLRNIWKVKWERDRECFDFPSPVWSDNAVLLMMQCATNMNTLLSRSFFRCFIIIFFFSYKFRSHRYPWSFLYDVCTLSRFPK